MTARQGSVTPKGNRMLVFTTSDLSYHGHPDGLDCPEDVARRSMALYYFTEEKEQPVRRSTHYRARPEDGSRKYLIAADRKVGISTTGSSAACGSPTRRRRRS